MNATIDGLPVEITDWQADATVDHGDRSCSGKIPEAFTSAEQEAPLILWLDNGEPLWQGRLALDPVTERGKRSISARGYAEDISADEARMFYRIDGGENFVERDSDPHNYSTVEKYELNQRPGSLVWRYGGDGSAYVAGDSAGFVIWVEGGLITRYEFEGTLAPASIGGFDVRTQQGTGPDGSLATVADASATTASFAANLSPAEDLLLISIRQTGALTPTAPRRFRANAIKIYGQTTDDDYSAGEVVTDVAASAGFDVGAIRTNPLAVLPLDWSEDHADLLTYMAALTDWHWEAYGPAVHFGPWEETWTASITTGARPTWENQPRYNQVRVPFTYISGAEGSATAAPTVDPFPGQTVTYTADALEHPQQTSALASAVAANLVEHHASRRVGGRLELGRVTDATGRPTSGFEVKPGHLIQIPERADLGPQRIVGMNYRESGSPVAELNSDFNVIRLLNEIRVPKKKRKRKR